MIIFSAALGTESNTFSPLPTGWRSFQESMYHRGDGSEHAKGYFAGPLRVWRERCAKTGDRFIESLAATAQPGAKTAQAVWERLRDELLSDLRAAGPVDIVLLHLHGAMVSTGCDDCEGELLSMVREVVGPKVVIGVELDLHCHLTDQMVTNADLVVMYREYPHTDVNPRAAELFDLCRRAASGEIRPVLKLIDCAMIGTWRSSEPQVRAIIDLIEELIDKDGILTASFCHGFPRADVPEVGAKCFAIADGDPAKAEAAAQRLAAAILDLRRTHREPLVSTSAAVSKALASPGVTVIADVGDNAGGGATADTTWLLHEVIAQGAPKALLGHFWDPVAVRICEEAGVGSKLTLRIGGKIAASSGTPFEGEVEVIAIAPEAFQTYGQGRQAMGCSALVRAGGIDMILTSIRTQWFHPDALEAFDIHLRDYPVVVVKSAQHFYDGFAPVADQILYAAAQGAATPLYDASRFTRTSRPLWVGDRNF